MEFHYTFVIKIFLATILGFILGVQRERVGKPVGSRTMSLVTLGATVFTIMSAEGFSSFGGVLDTSRIAAQIVMGIGFLGGGIIIFDKDKVKGVTTAASLWVAAALGVVVGVGWYLEAIILTLLTLFLLYISHIQIEKKWLKK